MSYVSNLSYVVFELIAKDSLKTYIFELEIF